MVGEPEIPQKRDAMVKIMKPRRKIFFLPKISATLPQGTMEVTEARVKLVATQLSKTASILKSAAIDGRAMYVAEAIKGVRKLLNVTLTSADRLRPVSSIGSHSFSN
jgi:hypothetical protein